MELDRDDQCFCCGAANERGLRLAISYPEPGRAEARFTVPTHFSGWKGLTHGGLLSTVLDELMAHACIGAGSPAVTGEITVRFLKPLATGTEVRVVGRLEGTRGRVLSTRGWVYGPSAVVVAEGTAKFIRKP